jgi:large subunit ribosomal protein L15
MNLSTLRAPKRSSENRKRVGRGMGSGMGKTSTRGHKGQGSRSGSRLLRGFEGGQMPLHRRLPKRGFVNIFREEYVVVNLSDLARLGETSITPDLLRSRGLVRGRDKRVKVLGDGELSSALAVQAHKFSKSAEEKIRNAGGSATIIEVKPAAPVANKFKDARAQKRAGKQKKQA